MAKKRTGRPRGSKTASAVDTHNTRPHCPRCGSSKRHNFRGAARVVTGPVRNPADGRWYGKKTGRRTRCAEPDCGQVRIEWEYIDPVPERPTDPADFIVGL